MSEKDQIWYSNALDALSPLRFHMNNLLISLETLNHLQDSLGKPNYFTGVVKDAQEALDAAERFFTGKVS